jgi:hypothetical protein
MLPPISQHATNTAPLKTIPWTGHSNKPSEKTSLILIFYAKLQNAHARNTKP